MKTNLSKSESMAVQSTLESRGPFVVPSAGWRNAIRHLANLSLLQSKAWEWSAGWKWNWKNTWQRSWLKSWRG